MLFFLFFLLCSYCECFNAGEYCAEPCTCQNCYNRPDYEDTVLGMRQQIECRNSLAFAPKIVRCGRESPQNSGVRTFDKVNFTVLSSLTEILRSQLYFVGRQ